VLPDLFLDLVCGYWCFEVPPVKEASILSFIAAETKNSAKLVSNVEGHMTFQFPRSENDDQSDMMANFFGKLEDQKEALGQCYLVFNDLLIGILGVLDFSIGMTTLEDVFINTAHKDEEDERKRAEEKEIEQQGETRIEEENSPKAGAGDVELQTFNKSQEHKIDDTALLADTDKGAQTKWQVFQRQFTGQYQNSSYFLLFPRFSLSSLTSLSLFSPFFLLFFFFIVFGCFGLCIV